MSWVEWSSRETRRTLNYAMSFIDLGSASIGCRTPKRQKMDSSSSSTRKLGWGRGDTFSNNRIWPWPPDEPEQTQKGNVSMSREISFHKEARRVSTVHGRIWGGWIGGSQLLSGESWGEISRYVYFVLLLLLFLLLLLVCSLWERVCISIVEKPSQRGDMISFLESLTCQQRGRKTRPRYF